MSTNLPNYMTRPESLIGKSERRPEMSRLTQGHGTYVDDILLPRMVHAYFVRSPYAHARIVSIDTSEAETMPGVVKTLTGEELKEHCTPWQGVLSHMAGMKSAVQHPIAIDRACWQGEPVVAIVAESRAEAEDAAENVLIEWESLSVVADKELALAADTPVIHPELGDNLCYEHSVDTGEIDAIFDQADTVIEETFEIERHTTVSLETRSILADYNPGDEQLTVYLSSQAPYMMQYLFAEHLGLLEANVRVKVPDMGGGFGLKIHVYGDEMATAALSKMLKRPVKHIADRLESFVSDNHSREHSVKVRLAADSDGKFLAWDVDDLCGGGAYSVYPRGSVNEAKQVINLTGGPYQAENYRAQCKVVFQNKAMLGQYRAVGHPIACSVTEGMVDRAASKLGIDPVEIRRQNFIAEDAFPYKAASGVTYEKLSQQDCMDRLMEMIDYPSLRAEQSRLRDQGIYRGIGLACFIEMTNPSSATYGVGDAPISSQDGCSIQMAAQGTVTCSISLTELGQGARAMVAQIVASALGIDMAEVNVVLGDTENTPYGGGNWGSRGAGIGGEAALQAAKALRQNILATAAFLLQMDEDSLDLSDGNIVEAATGDDRMSIKELAHKTYFRTDLFPKDFQPELMVIRYAAQKDYDGIATNGVQACYLEVDVETGFVKLLNHWIVHDCGTIINPDIVNEQIRGAVVQGLGGALGENCIYSPDGQMLNGTLAEYLVPMASEMPDIEIGHVVTPTQSSELGAKGAAEAGTAGAPAAVMNALNDALSPFDTQLAAQPFTPERILRALGKP